MREPASPSRRREELLASGARPRTTAVSGAEALTPSESRVARMAAEGLTNREIAQALFVTPKTVEVHLGSAYRKLGISSRMQLAGRDGRAGGVTPRRDRHRRAHRHRPRDRRAAAPRRLRARLRHGRRRQAAADELRALGPLHHAWGDLADPNEPKRIVAEVVDHFGRLDVLVNNAGISTAKPALELTADDFDRTFDVDVRAAFLASQEAARR